MVSTPMKTLVALLPFFLQATSVAGQASGTGTTTRYWDCCKPSCSWSGKTTLASGSTPVLSCDINDNPISDAAASACNGGSSYMCTNESPWAVSDTLAYGYAAVSIAGGTEDSWCCACYELTFTSGPVAGKQLIVQATNTGGDLGSNQFDLSIPGGGFGIFNGCTSEWGTPSTGWGAQYGGISSRSQCDAFPAKLKDGCYWHYDWFMGADNPTVSFKQVTCPAALTAKTGCIRNGETPTGPKSVNTWTSGAGGSSSTKVSTQSTIKVSVSKTQGNTLSTSMVAASKTNVNTLSTSTVASSKTKASTSVAATTYTSTGSGTVSHYGQCGGAVWSGGTACVSPYTCVYSNAWYSQCL